MGDLEETDLYTRIVLRCCICEPKPVKIISLWSGIVIEKLPKRRKWSPKQPWTMLYQRTEDQTIYQSATFLVYPTLYLILRDTIYTFLHLTHRDVSWKKIGMLSLVRLGKLYNKENLAFQAVQESLDFKLTPLSDDMSQFLFSIYNRYNWEFLLCILCW